MVPAQRTPSGAARGLWTWGGRRPEQGAPACLAGLHGDTLTLRLEPGSEKTVWVKYPGESPGPACDITGPGAPRLDDPGADVFLTRDETWTPLHTIDAPQAGDYRITCSSQALSRYAVGESGGLVTLAGRLILAVLLAVLGLGIGAVIVLVTALRRRGHRKRLLAERR
ncbi:hypothetical protein K7B06_31760 [Streptomyces erythrochromogenes]|nr:hypothetical protein [Streptomyces erythrochromogenes]